MRALAVLGILAILFAAYAVNSGLIDLRSDPLYAEAVDFIETDKTDDHTYILGTYDCHEYTMDTQYNASVEGIRCAYVWIYFAGSASDHAIVAFDTTDRGIVFFEPQVDLEVDVEIGQYYVTPGSSHMVEDIDFVWYVVKTHQQDFYREYMS